MLLVFSIQTATTGGGRRNTDIFAKNNLAASSASAILLTLFLQLAIYTRGAASTEDVEFAGQNIVTRNGITYGVVNRTVIIPCGVERLVEGSDSSNPTIAWFKGGQSLENLDDVSVVADNLMIHEFSDGAVGDYQCTKTYDFGTIAGNIIRLRSAETYPIMFDNSIAAFAAGNPLRLVCPVKLWAPTIAVRWFKDSEPLILDSDRVEMLPGWLLHISNLTEGDSGEYSCSSKTVGGDYMDSVNNVSVSVQTPAVADSYTILATPPAELDVILDQEAVIECVLNPANGESTVWQVKVSTGSGGVEWREVVAAGRVIIQPNQYIKWTSVDGSISEEYRCNVLSSSGETLDSFHTRTTLVYTPTSTGSLYNEIEVQPASFAKLDCDIIGNPEPFITWYKDGVPLDICHDVHVSGTTLTVERLSYQDAGLYQCMASNSYGTQSLIFQLSIPVKSGVEVPPMPVITSARFVEPVKVEVTWRTEAAVGSINYYTLVFARQICLPHVRSDSEVLFGNADQCSECADAGSVCCRHTVEVHKSNENYILQVIAYSSNGAIKSLPAEAVATGDVTTTAEPSKPLNMQVTDFGSVMLAQWMSVEKAAGYRLDVQWKSHRPQSIVQADLRERSNDQPYDIILAPTENSLFTLKVEAVQNPVEYRQVLQFNITRPKFTEVPGAPQVTIVSSGDGVMVFWTMYPNVSYYHLWYNCDGREKLQRARAGQQMTIVDVVEKGCTVVVAPVVGEEARPAGVALYERWCNYISKPYSLLVTPYHSQDLQGYPMKITWAVQNKSLVANCEINYLVRWKKAVSDVYLEQHSTVVTNKYSAIIEGLVADFTYEFQVMAFTNVSDETSLSNTVSFTVGPPLNPKNVAVDTRRFPDAPVAVTWSTAGSGHDINLYIVVLFQALEGEWVMTNTTVVEVTSGEALRVEYEDLLYETEYKVNISSINTQGPSGVSAVTFVTPPLVLPPTTVLSTQAATALTTSAPTAEPPANATVLTPVQIGVVIGVALSFVVVFISALVCIIARKRFKSEERRRQQCRNRSTRFESSSSYSCQQPLTIDTSHYEMATCLGDTIPQHNLDNGDAKHCSPLAALSSPLQPANQATSGQDSGIGGTAEDHRSSQDLEEYDDDGDGLISSNLSLNSRGSSSRPVFSQRWSGEHSYGFEPSSRPTRIRAESECDSLLTDSRRVDSSLHDKLLNKCSHNSTPPPGTEHNSTPPPGTEHNSTPPPGTEISDYLCLDGESLSEMQALTSNVVS